jgi:hypothetical protein
LEYLAGFGGVFGEEGFEGRDVGIGEVGFVFDEFDEFGICGVVIDDFDKFREVP